MKVSHRPASVLSVLLFMLLESGAILADPGPTMARQAWSLRPSDGLLERKDLQAVVAAQSRRDAAVLGGFFTHDDVLVRARAAFGAGSVQDPSLVAGLLQLLGDPDPR